MDPKVLDSMDKALAAAFKTRQLAKSGKKKKQGTFGHQEISCLINISGTKHFSCHILIFVLSFLSVGMP